MFVDKQTLFSDDVELTTSADYYSEFAYNLGSTKDPGGGRPMYLVICVTEAFVTADSADLVIFLVDEEDNTLAGTSVEIIQTDVLAASRLTLGKVIILPIPAGLITQQYIGVKYTVGTGTFSAGTITSFIALDPLSNMGA